MLLWSKKSFGLFEMTAPLISIIIPTYNSADTIKRCLDSLVNQSFRNFEIIVMDGVSSDSTIYIIGEYQRLFSNIDLVSEKDSGIYDAMNKGIEMAKGEWIYFIGSDDFMFDHNVLKDLTSNVNLDEYEFVYGDVILTEYGKIYDGSFDNSKILDRNICHQALFVRKSVFAQIGRFDTKYRFQADYDFNLRVMFNDRIKKKYVKLTIAYYSLSGLSSLNTDELFVKDKDFLVFKYGFNSLSWRQRLQYAGIVVKRALRFS